MHVVYIITKLELGGAQKVCLALHAGLKHANISSTLISGNEGALVASVRDDSSVILLPSLKRELSISGILGEVQSFFGLISTLRSLKKKSQKPFIVHTHSTKAGILGRWAAFFARADAIVHTVHGFAFHEHQPWLVWLIIVSIEWFTALITSQFVVVSSVDQATGSKLLPRFARHNTMIRAAAFTHPPSNFTRPLRTFGDDQPPFIIGTVSCFKPQKNLQDLITIFASLVTTTSANMRLEIIGDGEQRPMLEALAHDLNIAHLVTFAGWQQSIAPWLTRWDLFALTSLWEGLPCAVVEARLFKLPVIAYNTGGIKDVITTGVNGVIVDQLDKQGFAAAVQKYYQDANAYNRLAQHPDDLTAFTVEAMVKEHIKLYETLCP